MSEDSTKTHSNQAEKVWNHWKTHSPHVLFAQCCTFSTIILGCISPQSPPGATTPHCDPTWTHGAPVWEHRCLQMASIYVTTPMWKWIIKINICRTRQRWSCLTQLSLCKNRKEVKEETTRYFLFPSINVTNIFFSTYNEKFNLMGVQAGTWKTLVLSYVQCISIHAMHAVLTGAWDAVTLNSTS